MGTSGSGGVKRVTLRLVQLEHRGGGETVDELSLLFRPCFQVFLRPASRIGEREWGRPFLTSLHDGLLVLIAGIGVVHSAHP